MKISKLFLIAAATMSVMSCSKPDEGKEELPTVKDGTYVGTVTVDQNDGTKYTQENVTVMLQLNEGKATIKMMQVAFSDKMPVKLDMTIPGITTAEVAEGLAISGNNIVPQAMGGDFPKYTIQNMVGKVTTAELSFDMKCGEFPFSFKGNAAKN